MPKQHPPYSQWDDLVGARVTVTRADATRVHGRLLAIDERAISLSHHGTTLVLEATEVRRVERAGTRAHRTLGGTLGMLFGGLAMLAHDWGSGNPEPVQAFVMGIVLIGVPLGALVASILYPSLSLYVAPTAAARDPLSDRQVETASERSLEKKPETLSPEPGRSHARLFPSTLAGDRSAPRARVDRPSQ